MKELNQNSVNVFKIIFSTNLIKLHRNLNFSVYSVAAIKLCYFYYIFVILTFEACKHLKAYHLCANCDLNCLCNQTQNIKTTFLSNT